GQGLCVSCDHLPLRMRVAVELAEQGIAVLVGPVGQLLDEVLNVFVASVSERLRTAEVDGISLYQFWIKLVLANDLAEAVPHLGASAVSIAIRILWRKLLAGVRNCPDFLDRADADAVRLAKGAVHGTSFRNPKL